MAATKGIRGKIKSVKSTQRITKAMELVAASKMRRAQDRMLSTKPYANRIKKVINHLASGNLEYQHPYLTERKVKRVGFMVISSDRGLCGGLNTNLFKTLVKSMQDWEQKNIPVELCTIGKKAENFLSRFGANLLASVKDIGDAPTVENLIGAVKIMLDAYVYKKVDKVFIVYNEFINTMTQQPVIEQLLPLPKGDSATTSRFSWDYIYEPGPEELLDVLLQRYIESLVYQAVIDNLACEQAARMVAMKSASDNAGDIIDELLLKYNKARQAAITQEIAEIVSGAAAV